MAAHFADNISGLEGRLLLWNIGIYLIGSLILLETGDCRLMIKKQADSLAMDLSKIFIHSMNSITLLDFGN